MLVAVLLGRRGHGLELPFAVQVKTAPGPPANGSIQQSHNLSLIHI